MADPAGELYGRYRRLLPVQRWALWIAMAIEVVLIVHVQRDIQTRPDSEIRKPKFLWRLAGTQNIVGPLAYLRFGRR